MLAGAKHAGIRLCKIKERESDSFVGCFEAVERTGYVKRDGIQFDGGGLNLY